MYLAFDLQIKDDFNDWSTVGEKIFKEQKRKITKALDDYYLSGGEKLLNGTELQQDWFPEIKADLFLSHSHSDERNAISFAGWLYEKFGLTSFIDSTVWGYANDLLKLIDDEHCRSKSGNTYDYDKRNYSTSHIHMMLMMALSKMIDKTECSVFLNSTNSIDTVMETIKQGTKSPWIYAELVILSLVRQTVPDRIKTTPRYFEKRAFNESSKWGIIYDVNQHLNDLIKIDQTHLKKWLSDYQTQTLTGMLSKDKIDYSGVHALDYLYAPFKKG